MHNTVEKLPGFSSLGAHLSGPRGISQIPAADVPRGDVPDGGRAAGTGPQQRNHSDGRAPAAVGVWIGGIEDDL